MTFDEDTPAAIDDCPDRTCSAHERTPWRRHIRLVDEHLCAASSRSDAIGRAAAALCSPLDSIILVGTSPAFLAMARHLAGTKLQVLANGCRTIEAFAAVPGLRVCVPGGLIMPNDGMIYCPSGGQHFGAFNASKIFISASGVGARGVTHAGLWTSAAARSLRRFAETVVVLADSEAFDDPSGEISFGLDEIDLLITVAAVSAGSRALLKAAGVGVLLADC